MNSWTLPFMNQFPTDDMISCFPLLIVEPVTCRQAGSVTLTQSEPIRMNHFYSCDLFCQLANDLITQFSSYSSHGSVRKLVWQQFRWCQLFHEIHNIPLQTTRETKRPLCWAITYKFEWLILWGGGGEKFAVERKYTRCLWVCLMEMWHESW